MRRLTTAGPAAAANPTGRDAGGAMAGAGVGALAQDFANAGTAGPATVDPAMGRHGRRQPAAGNSGAAGMGVAMAATSGTIGAGVSGIAAVGGGVGPARAVRPTAQPDFGSADILPAQQAPRTDAVAPATGPLLASFRDVAALVATQREALLHAHLLHSVHLVRFAPPVIEIRPQPEAPRDLAARLGALLREVTGTRWTIALSSAPGEPTLAEQGSAADAARRSAAADHPLVKAILAAFPGARIDAVHDSAADAYGLRAAGSASDAEPPLAMDDGDPDMPDFAPPDAEPLDESSFPWESDA
jgi:DNA polymerase-3 subunit gamma/tau